jgi:aspartate dehydrogenase
VAAQEHGALLAKRRGHSVAQFARADQSDPFEQRHAIGQHGARVVHDAHGLADLAERNARWGMDVRDRSDLRPRRVDARMNPQLGVWLAIAPQPLAIDIENEQSIGARQSRARVSGKEKRLGARNARTDVPERRHQTHAVDDAIGQRDLGAQIGRHWVGDRVSSLCMALRVGLIGLGTIGSGVMRLLRADDDITIVGALVRRARVDSAVPTVTRVDDLLALEPDVVVEVAGHEALRGHGPRVLRAGCDLIVLSVGALADPTLEADIMAAARIGRSRAMVAAGAIGGLDALGAAAVGGLERVTHTTRKPARALLPADEAASLREPRELFRGSAREGALRFPENINVAAAVSLAGIGLDRTEVCVVADPTLERNTHQVVAQGTFGELRFEIRGIPSDENPRTGRIVAMSVVNALRRLRAPLVIG